MISPYAREIFVDSTLTDQSSILRFIEVRELDERLGLSALIAENIMDDRRTKNTQ